MLSTDLKHEEIVGTTVSEMMELYPPVRIDIMRKALTAFGTALHRYPPDTKKRFRKVEAAVYRSVKEDDRKQMSYMARCYAFRLFTKDLTLKSAVKTFGKWLVLAEDGSFVLHDAILDAVAITPMCGRGTRFLKSDFLATVEKIGVERYGSQP
jgi:hypothetical protein